MTKESWASNLAEQMAQSPEVQAIYEKHGAVISKDIIEQELLKRDECPISLEPFGKNIKTEETSVIVDFDTKTNKITLHAFDNESLATWRNTNNNNINPTTHNKILYTFKGQASRQVNASVAQVTQVQHVPYPQLDQQHNNRQVNANNTSVGLSLNNARNQFDKYQNSVNQLAKDMNHTKALLERMRHDLNNPQQKYSKF